MLAEVRCRAEADIASVTALASDLVRVPSRGGIDDYEPVLSVAEEWLAARHLPHRRLSAPDGTTVALLVEIRGDRPGPTWILDACLDTAPFGDEAAWSFSPTSGDVSPSGFLLGRGAADSKTAAAVFCHVAAAVHGKAAGLAGSLIVLLDVDEHTGRFGGAVALMQTVDPVSIGGAMIGYPGIDEVIVGGRGVYRARIRVDGTAAHSGSSKPSPPNAASRAARLVTMLEETPLPVPRSGGFPLPPRLTVTEVRSGEGFTAVPDQASVSVDVRLTDVLDAEAAEKLVRQAAADLDATFPANRPTEIERVLSWPPYQLAPTTQPAAALLGGAAAAGLTVQSRVAGPSNIGNLFATSGIATTAGFGVPFTGLHGTDEQADLSALPAIQTAYHHAILTLMS
ncbi:M20 family metallopeptidase [Kribbella sp. NPDC055110]